MRIVFVCASVDVQNAVVGDTLDRAQTIAGHPRVASLAIVSLHGTGEWEVRGLKVYGIGSDRLSRGGALASFFRVIWRVYKDEKPTVFYLYMCPTLAPLLLPYRLFAGVSIVQWFGHAHYTMRTKIALKYFCDLWFNSNKSMAPFPVKHLRLVGQGVKADQFFYDPKIHKKFDLITVGRLAPIKKIEQILEVLQICRDQYGKCYTLNICGDAFAPGDLEYKKKLEDLVKAYNLTDQVRLSGMVAREQMPTVLQQAKVFIFLVHGGVGKASLEAIACGVPVVISTPEARDFFGDELSQWFLCEKDLQTVSKAVIKILEAPPEIYRELAQKANGLFLEKYSMDKFIDRIVTVMDRELG